MMTRTQISFHPEMLRRARRKAADSGISLAEYIRRLVARDLDSARVSHDPAAVFNLGDSGGSDIARDKDRLVADAVQARYERPRQRG